MESGVSQQTNTGDNGEKTKGPMFTSGGKPGPGRPKMVDNRDYVAALKAGFPPDKIVELLNAAIDIAVRTNSWRGVVAAADFAAQYSLGKPKQRIETSEGTSLAELLESVDTSAPLLPARKPDAEPAPDNL